MPDNMELLEQRVTKQQQKLEQASTVVELTQARLDVAARASDDADRERRRLASALELAERRAKRLAKEAKGALKLADAVGQDRADAENELAENVKAQQKRQAKLAKAEAALAAAKATQDVGQAATKKATPRKRAAATTTKATPRKRATTKSTAKSTATKRAPARKTTKR